MSTPPSVLPVVFVSLAFILSTIGALPEYVYPYHDYNYYTHQQPTTVPTTTTTATTTTSQPTTTEAYNPPQVTNAPYTVCPTHFVHVGDKCLWVSQRTMNRRAASNFCRKYKMNLLEIPTGNEYVDVVAVLKETGRHNKPYWLGASIRLGQKWGWDRNGSTIPKPFWAIKFQHGKTMREPSTDPLTSCAFLDPTRFLFIKTDGCHEIKNFICERPTLEDLYNSQEYSVKVGAAAAPMKMEILPPMLIPSCPQGYKGHPSDALTCYKIIDEKLNFADARSSCEEQGGLLASINNREENNFVFREFMRPVIVDEEFAIDNFWLGLLRNEDSSLSYWLDGNQLEFTNWGAREPSNVEDGGENCIAMSALDGTWGDHACQKMAKSVCKKKLITIGI